MTGSQKPRISIEPRATATDGGDAALLMSAYAYELDPWQRQVVDCWLSKDERGRYAVTSAGLSLPRQNGKNVCLEAREFLGLAARGERILHTAHQVRTSKQSFRRLERIFTDKRHPELQQIVKTIRYTNGEEAIELDNGGCIYFLARSRQAARGIDGISLVVFDEAQELTDDQMEAILSTLSASVTGTRQLILAGTPPYPGCPGTVFRRTRTACMTDPDPTSAWHEWSVEAKTVGEIDLDDKKLWRTANPALGLRLTEAFTQKEREMLSDDGFARERLGWWSPLLAHAEDYAISAAVWDECGSREEKPEGKTAYGVKFSADGSEVTLAGAVIRKDGIARISLIDRRPTGHGTRWLADWLNERYTRASCVVIDGRNGADVLVEKIRETWKAKASVVRPSAKDVVAAAGTLCDALAEHTVTWYAPQTQLRESAITATKRPIGGGWGFGGENAGPVEACALALWGARTCKRDPTRRMRIG